MGQDIDSLNLVVAADVRKLVRAMDKAKGSVEKNSRSMERNAKRATDSMNRHFSSLKATAGSLAIYLGVGQVRDYADAWLSVKNQLQDTEDIIKVQIKNRKELLELANRSGSDLDATAQLYNRTAVALSNMTKEEKIFATVTDTVAKSLKLGKLAASEQASVMLQLSQAFNKGRLDGDEFKSVSENAVRLMTGFAKQLGVTRGELLKMSSDGKLSVEQLVAAIVKMAPEIDKAFAKTIPTIGRSLIYLNNQMTAYIGNLAETKGLSAAVTALTYGLANNMDAVGNSALTAGAYILGAFGPAAIAAVGRFGVALAFSTGGLSALTGGVAAALTALALFGDDITLVSGEFATLTDYGSALWDVLADGAGEAGAFFRDGLVKAIDLVSSALGGVGTDFNRLGLGVKTVYNTIITLLVGSYNAVVQTWNRLPDVIGDAMVTAMNALIKELQEKINASINLLNEFIGAVSGVEKAFSKVEFGQFGNDFKGAGLAYGKALADGFKDGVDYIGDFADEIQKRANDKASARISNKKISPVNGAKTITPVKSNHASSGKANSYDTEIANLKKRIALLGVEASVLGKSQFEAEKAKAAFKLLEAAKQSNVPITDDLTNKIDMLASGYATATVKLDQMKEAQASAAARSAELQSTFEDATSSIVKGLVAGKDAAEVFSDALASVGDRLLDLALDDVFSSLKGGGANGGSFFGSLFSGAGAGAGGLFGGSIIPGILHSGGVAGSDGYSHSRSFSPSVFDGAPRYHNGGVAGLKPDEVPAILKKGERILPLGFSDIGSSSNNSAQISLNPVYNIDARGAGQDIDQKLNEAFALNNRELQKNFSGMIKNEQNRGRV